MKRVAHRGYWELKSQQNTFESVMLGLLFSAGVEIDLRLHRGEVVLAHDHLPLRGRVVLLRDVLPLSLFFPGKIWALNIKEDGLSMRLRKTLQPYPNLQYFCFDMSFPETLLYIQTGIKTGARVSDFEDENIWISRRAEFYVLDGFKKLETKRLQFHKPIMVISPELHGREENVSGLELVLGSTAKQCYLCTDRILGNDR